MKNKAIHKNTEKYCQDIKQSTEGDTERNQIFYQNRDFKINLVNMSKDLVGKKNNISEREQGNSAETIQQIEVKVLK